MPPEVVGTAFVRIKALTDKLNKDIEKQVKKGMKDANLGKIGDAEGKELGENLGNSAVDETNKTLSKRKKDIVPEDLFSDVGDNLRRSLDKQSESVRGSLSRLRGLRPDPDEFDLIPRDDLPFHDSGRVEDFFDKLRGRLRSSKNDFEEWGRKTRASVGSTFENISGNIKKNVQGFRDWRRAADKESSGINTALDSISARLKSLGGSANLPGLSGRASIWGAIGAAILAALPLIQDIGSAILAYATGLVAQIGFVVTALGGLGVTAIAALGSSLIAVGPIALAFASQTKALEDFGDVMKAAGAEFLRIGTATQVTLLPALERAVDRLTDLVPLFSEFGFFVGRTVGDFAELAAETLTGEKAMGRFSAILRSSLNILDILLPAFINLGDILSGIWVAAIPATERFVGSLGRVVAHWRDLINEGLDSGSLTKTLNLWYERAEILGSALSNVTGALFDILQVGANSSDNLFVRFDEWARGYRDFTESEAGQNRLKLIFDNSLAVMREINGVVADLFDGIFGRLGNLGGVDGMVEALQNFREILPDLQEKFQNFLGGIERFTEIAGGAIWDRMKQTFEELKEPVGRLVVQFLEFLDAMRQSGAFDVFLDLMKILTDVLSTLLAIPGFGTFVGYLLAFGAAAKVATIALGPFTKILVPFVSALKGLAVARAGSTLAATASGMSKIAAQKSVKKALGDSADGISTLVASTAARGGGGIGGILKTIGGSLARLHPLGIAASLGVAAAGFAFFRHKKNAQEWKQEVRQVTAALGTLNGGLNITAEGVGKYILETSRFESRNQIDDLNRLSLSFEKLAEGVSAGTLSYTDFAEEALRASEIEVEISKVRAGGQRTADIVTQHTIDSLQELQQAYGLTNAELDSLAKGEAVYKDSTKIALSGNTDLLKSFKELNKGIGDAAKENINAFALNAQNIRLLGKGAVNDIAKSIREGDSEEAAEEMRAALAKLRDEAIKDTASIVGLSEATRNLAKEQARRADGTLDDVRYNELLRNEQSKLFIQMREGLLLLSDPSFTGTLAASSVQLFSDAVKDVDFDEFRKMAASGDIDVLQEKFGGLGYSTDFLFTQLATLPVDQFDAAANAMGFEAGSLREAIEGASRAIEELQNVAVSHLPTVGQLLDEATSTNLETGEEIFNEKAFTKSIDARIKETEDFQKNITEIQEKSGDAAARLAVREGPKAAAALAKMATGGPDDALRIAVDTMETTERNLRKHIEDELGEGIRLQYLGMAEPLSEGWGVGLANGINSPATLEALKGSSLDTLNVLAEGFRGHFVIDGDNELTFVHTGKFRGPRYTGIRVDTVRLSDGGFVGMSGVFNGGPKGTDTVPAWLTPGEFVLRRSIAQAIPSDVLTSLNAGDPRLLRMLSARNQGSGDLGSLARSSRGASTASGGSAFGPGSVVIYAQGTSAAEVYREFDSRTNWKLSSRGDA